MKKNILLLMLFLLVSSCGNETIEKEKYKTKNVFIVVVDGPRFSETWGDPTHKHIPFLANKLAVTGSIYNNFYNNGSTKTNAGHTAITTGVYQEIDNTGDELPKNPSLFQHWLESTKEDRESAWIIASKDKLEVLSNCQDLDWKDKFLPKTNCGIDGKGVGSGYRHDSLTYKKIFEVIPQALPNLVLINFREPDYSGHAGNWDKYLQGIKKTDTYIYRLWQLIQNNEFYQNSTALIVTNDHGRHLDQVKDGFISHGDDCEGCRHINFFATGPDFREDVVIDTPRELIDISATISHILGINMPNSKGEIMTELLKN